MKRKNISDFTIDPKTFTVHDGTDDYDDNIPEVDLPKQKDVIPDEVPRRDGPGGE